MQGAAGEHHEEEIAQLSAGIERQRRLQIAGLVVVVVFALLACLARIIRGDLLGIPFPIWVSLAAILLVMKLVYLFAAWRCPRCGGFLGSGYHPRFCSRCGLEFASARK